MKWIRWLGFGVALLAASGCGGVYSPILTFQQLPGRHLDVLALRGFTVQGDIGVLVTVTIGYDTTGDFCGTLKSPGATLGGVKLPVLSAGLKTVSADGEGRFECVLPVFQKQFGPGETPQGTLEVTDGSTTARAEFDALDPGTATLVFPTDGTLHPGQSARWHLNLPANHGLTSYSVDSESPVQYWVQGTGTPAGGDVVAAPPVGFAASYSGTGSLVLLWGVDAHVTACAAGFVCQILSRGQTAFRLSLGP